MPDILNTQTDLHISTSQVRSRLGPNGYRMGNFNPFV